MADIGITVSLEGLNKVIGDLGKLKGETEKAARGMNDAAKATNSAAKANDNFASSLVKIGLGVASIGAVVNHFNKIDDALTSTVKSAKAFGMSAETMERWRYAATTAGVDAERFTQSLEGLNAKAGEALINKMSDSGKAFAYLGVSVKDAEGKFRGVEAVFKDTIESLSEIEDSGTRSRIALALLGPEGAQLANTFRDGAAQFKEAGDRLTTVSDVLGNDAYKAFQDANGVVKDFNDSLNQLSTIAYAGAITWGTEFFETTILGAKLTIAQLDQLIAKWNEVNDPNRLGQFFKDGSPVYRANISADFAPPPPDLSTTDIAYQGDKPRFKSVNLYNVTATTKAIKEMTAAELIQSAASKTLASSLGDVAQKQEDILRANQSIINENLNQPFIDAQESAADFASTITDGLRGMISGTEDFGDQIDNIGKRLLETLADKAVLDPLQQALTGIFSGQGGQGGGLLSTFETGAQKFGEVFDANVPILGSLFDGLLGGMGNVFNNLLNGLGGALGGLLGGSSGGGIFGGLFKGALSFIPGGGFISSILGFATGGEMTVTQPTLFTAGERGAERIRVSPLAGGLAAGGGGGSGLIVNLPQGSIVSGISAGAFARGIAREVQRQQGRVV